MFKQYEGIKRVAITNLAMWKANLTQEEYDEADSHIPGHNCNSCNKFREYLEIKSILKEFLDSEECSNG